jgi:hypothetical protein
VLVNGATPSGELKKAIMDHVGKEVFSKPQQSMSCQHELFIMGLQQNLDLVVSSVYRFAK